MVSTLDPVMGQGPEVLNCSKISLRPRKWTERAPRISVKEIGKRRHKSVSESEGCLKRRSSGPPPQNDVAHEIVSALESVLEIYKLYGFNPPPSYYSRQLLKTAARWAAYASKCGWMKVVKYKLAAFMSFHTDNELPIAPFDLPDHPGIILGGRAYRWVQRVKRDSASHFLSFVTSVNMSKKGMPRALQTELKAAELKLVEHLTSSQKRSLSYGSTVCMVDFNNDTPSLNVKGFPLICHDLIDRQQIQLQIRRTVRELFEGKSYTVEDRIKPRFPSTSANYIRSRKNAGALGEILDHPELLDGLKSKSSLIKMRPPKYDEETIVDQSLVEYDDSELRRRYALLYWRALKRAFDESPDAQPVALAEALKIRVITKGPPLMNFVMKPLQNFLWKVLKNHSAFSLVGEPISESYVQDRMGSSLPEDEMYLSGDYSAATDNLAPWASETAADEISLCLGLTSKEASLFVRSLTGHTLSVKDGEKFPQVWGQLMGSITSFPVLCIINAAVCRAALEYASDRLFSLKDAHCAFNGDDVLLRINKKGHSYWQAITSYVGLEPSVGKCFYTKLFCQMNSTNFQRLTKPSSYFTIHPQTGRCVRREQFFKQVGYVNLGLMYGLCRSSVRSNSSDELPSGLGSRYRELIEVAPPELRARCHSGFIKHNRQKLEQFKLPWYIPEWLGGYGLIGVETPSKTDLRIAHKILIDHRVPDIFAISDAAAYSIHKYVMSHLPVKLQRFPSDRYLSGYRDLYSKLCIDSIFTSEIDELFDPNVKQDMKIRRLRSNERLWRDLLHKGNLPAPVSYAGDEPDVFVDKAPYGEVGILPQRVYSCVRAQPLSFT